MTVTDDDQISVYSLDSTNSTILDPAPEEDTNSRDAAEVTNDQEALHSFVPLLRHLSGFVDKEGEGVRLRAYFFDR